MPTSPRVFSATMEQPRTPWSLLMPLPPDSPRSVTSDSWIPCVPSHPICSYLHSTPETDLPPMRPPQLLCLRSGHYPPPTPTWATPVFEVSPEDLDEAPNRSKSQATWLAMDNRRTSKSLHLIKKGLHVLTPAYLTTQSDPLPSLRARCCAWRSRHFVPCLASPAPSPANPDPSVRTEPAVLPSRPRAPSRREPLSLPLRGARPALPEPAGGTHPPPLAAGRCPPSLSPGRGITLRMHPTRGHASYPS